MKRMFRYVRYISDSHSESPIKERICHNLIYSHCVGVSMCLLHIGYKNTHSMSKMGLVG